MFHKRLLKEFSDNKWQVAGMVLSQWISMLANVGLMLVLADYMGKLLMGTHLVTAEDNIGLGITFVAVFLVRAVAGTVNSRMSYAASKNVKVRLRELVFQKLLTLGSTYREGRTTSEVVQISTEGVEQLEIYFGKYVPQFFYSMLAPLTLFAVVGTISIKTAAVLFICVPLIPISIVAVQKFAKKLLAKYWGSYTGLGDSFLENLQGLTTLKIYQADERYAKKMDEEAENFRKVTMRVLIMQLNSISIMDLVAYGGAGLGAIFSVLEFKAGRVTIAECFFIIMIAAEFFLPMRLLGSFFHIAMNGNAAADKIFALLDTAEGEAGTVTKTDGETVVFDGVSFSYEEEKEVLKDISFSAPEGKLVALVGVSGCGKSTIASLMMGEQKREKRCGTITLGKVEVSELSKQMIYEKITRVRHDSYLFAGTVLENLRMGKPDAKISEMENALKQVDLYDTIMEKGGLSMQITEKAANLSGGQKQRLALARAILKDSDLYIFDEATSNIDVESENRIMEVVKMLAAKKTVILISHRLANVVDADRIFVLKDGTITEQGTHDALLREKGYYSSLYEAQRELECYGREAD